MTSQLSEITKKLWVPWLFIVLIFKHYPVLHIKNFAVKELKCTKHCVNDILALTINKRQCNLLCYYFLCSGEIYGCLVTIAK